MNGASSVPNRQIDTNNQNQGSRHGQESEVGKDGLEWKQWSIKGGADCRRF